jgi:hypothetical protein
MAVRASRTASRIVWLLVLPLLAACSSNPGATSGASPSTGTGGSGAPGGSPQASPQGSPAGTAQLILRITSEGGFIGPAANLNAVPEVSVYADGRIMTPGATDSISPPPLLPAVAIRDVGTSGAAAIIVAIRAAGLDHAGSSAAPGIPGDFGTTVFAVNVDGALVTTRIALGGGAPGRPGGGTSQDPGAAAATDLVNRLQDPNETWGASNVTTTMLTPTAYRVFVAPGTPASDGTMSTQPVVTWPLATPLAAFGVAAVPDRGIAGLRQGAVFGSDAATLGPLLVAANSQTAFSSGGMLYTLYVRPLLPDEVPAPG